MPNKEILSVTDSTLRQLESFLKDESLSHIIENLDKSKHKNDQIAKLTDARIELQKHIIKLRELLWMTIDKSKASPIVKNEKEEQIKKQLEKEETILVDKMRQAELLGVLGELEAYHEKKSALKQLETLDGIMLKLHKHEKELKQLNQRIAEKRLHEAKEKEASTATVSTASDSTVLVAPLEAAVEEKTNESIAAAGHFGKALQDVISRRKTMAERAKLEKEEENRLLHAARVIQGAFKQNQKIPLIVSLRQAWNALPNEEDKRAKYAEILMKINIVSELVYQVSLLSPAYESKVREAKTLLLSNAEVRNNYAKFAEYAVEQREQAMMDIQLMEGLADTDPKGLLVIDESLYLTTLDCLLFKRLAEELNEDIFILRGYAQEIAILIMNPNIFILERLKSYGRLDYLEYDTDEYAKNSVYIDGPPIDYDSVVRFRKNIFKDFFIHSPDVKNVALLKKLLFDFDMVYSHNDFVSP